MTHLLEVLDLKKHFPGRSGIFGGSKKTVRAVDGVSFTVDQERHWACRRAAVASRPW
jgi:ABC-type oligopeptide transport system ATPase subunit